MLNFVELPRPIKLELARRNGPFHGVLLKQRRVPESGLYQKFGPIGLEESLNGHDGSHVYPQPSLLERLRYPVMNEPFSSVGD